MKNKTIFTREAARRNVHANSPVYTNEAKVIDLSPIVSQYSQLRLKSNWKILSSSGKIHSQENSDRSKHEAFMAGVTGDESPLSYLQATVCYHHLMEYSDQPTDVIPQAIIDDQYIVHMDLFHQWNFEAAKRSLNPIFFYDTLMHPAIIFFTFHREGSEVIQKHVHRFSYGSYKLKTLQRTWDSVS